MPAKKGDSKPASGVKKAVSPAKSVAKAPVKAVAKTNAKVAPAKKGAAKVAAKPTRPLPKKLAKRAAKKELMKKSAEKVNGRKARLNTAQKAVVNKKASKAKKTIAKKTAPKAVAVAKGTAASKTVVKAKPQVKKVKMVELKNGRKRVVNHINRKKMVSLKLRQKRKENFEKILIQRRQANKKVWDAKQKVPKVSAAQRKANAKAKADKPKLTEEQKKALGPFKLIHKRPAKLPKKLQLATRLTTKGNVWTPHVYRQPKGHNALKIRMGKLNAVHRAIKAKNMIGGGARKRNLRKIWTRVQFRRPKTQRLPKNPQYPRKSIPRRPRLDQFAVLKHPYTTETAMKKLDDENTLVFVVDMKANKHKIRAAVKKMYDIKPFSIRTVVTPLATKKAFVRLHPDNDALDVANKIGMV